MTKTKELFTWCCPLCEPEIGSFTRASQMALDIATAGHMLKHMESFALAAVDHARIQCQNTACSLGCNKMYDPKVGFVQRLTEFDKTLLVQMKIKSE